jgi:GNAT superfamily N-acetyltransferase
MMPAKSTWQEGPEYIAVMNDICFRQMIEDDVEAADELRRLIGWNQTLADWHRILKLSPQGCFVATRDSALLGTVTSITYQETLSWIGMMLVHPEHRRQGIGRHLMRKVLAYLQGCGLRCIKLDATPLGLPLYRQLGFVPEWTLTRWQGQGKARAFIDGTSNQTRNLRDEDWAVVQEIDKGALGVSRLSLIQRLALDSQRVVVWPSQGRVVGWGLRRSGTNADYLGPIVCCDNDGALGLVYALLANAGDRPVFWDVPDKNAAAVSAVQQLGFTPIRALTRMRLGPAIVKSDPQAQFAIADPSAG